MPAPNKMKQIEQREGLPMREILRQLYNKHGSQTEVAKALGVGQGTVSNWLVKLRLKEKTIIVPDN